MSDVIKEQKCPNCGAPLRYDPASGKLCCDYCDSSFDIEEVEAAAKQDVEQVAATHTTQGLQDLRVYICKSCGAEVIADPQRVALTCPYCTNNIALTDKTSGDLRPDGIVPFRITPDKLAENVRHFYKDKQLLPKNFFSDRRVGTVQGIYVPFWIFDCDTRSELHFPACKVRTHRQGDYIITETDNYRVEQIVRMSFANIPTDASQTIDDALMDSLEPFDLSELKGFDLRYLAGYVADRFDVDAEKGRERAMQRVRNSIASVAHGRAEKKEREYDTITSPGVRLMDHKINAQYVLLPVYLFSIQYKGRSYSFAVNGQTGKVVGNLPDDKATKKNYFWKWTGVGFAVSFLVGILSFLFA